MRRFIFGVTGRRVLVGLLAVLALAACSNGGVDSLFTAPGTAGSPSAGAGANPAAHAGAPDLEGAGTGAIDVQGGASSGLGGAAEIGGTAGSGVIAGGASGAAGTIGGGGSAGTGGSAASGGTGGTAGAAAAGGFAGKGGTGGSAGTAGNGGSAGKGGSGGSAGTSGSGGSSGSAGTGAGGNAGTSGSAGTSGNAGAGGTGPLDCIGRPLPVTAPATVQVSGQANVITNGALAAASGITIQARTTMVLASSTSNGTGGYSLSVPTGGVPLAAHLEGKGGSYWDSYLYPDDPLANDLHADLLLVTANDAAAAATYANVTLNPNRALVLVRVLDCNGMAANSATVSVKQAGVSVGTSINLAALLPAAGTAIVLNVPPGKATTVAGAIGQSALRSNTIVPVGGALNLVILAPN